MSSAAVRPPCDEAVIRCGEARTGDALWAMAPSWTLAAAVLGSSMAFIDATVVNVALPAIQRDLGASAAALQWVVEAYALTLSALLLVGGALGDRLGRRRVFTAGTALFAVASLACGLAPSTDVLVASRALQGVAGALLTPGSLALISAVYPADRRGRAIGTWSAATSMTSAGGPLLGGLLVEHASWRWAFLINLPIAVAVLLICRTKVPENRDDSVVGRIDWPGALLATLGLGLVVLGLVDSQTSGLAARRVLAALVGGLVVLAAFLAVEARDRPRASAGGSSATQARAPMLDLGLFGSRDFSVTNLLTLLLYAALGGSLFFVPLDLIEVRGYSPAGAGASLLPFVALLSVLSRNSGAIADRIGSRIPLVVGPAITALGFVLFAQGASHDGYLAGVFPAVVVLGLGMGITVAPLTATVMASVATRHAGAASGVNNAVARTAGLLAIAILGIVLVHGFDTGLDHRLDSLNLAAAQRNAVDAQRSRLAQIDAPAELDAARRASVHQAVDDAFIDGFRNAMLVGAGLAAGSAVIAGVGLRRSSGRGQGRSPTPEY